LQPLRGVRGVMKAVSALPLVDGAFTHAITRARVAAVSELAAISARVAGVVRAFLCKPIIKTRLPGGLLL
jgi:hypothetical protein